MCSISDRKISLAVFKFRLNGIIAGEAICSYDYNTIRDDFDNLLSIDMYIGKNPPLVMELYTKKIEAEIIINDDYSQAKGMIKSEIYPMFRGVDIELFKTTFEFKFSQKDNSKIKLTKIERSDLEYEITNIETGKSYVLTRDTEAEVIDFAYSNL
ncbi:hypothetical protein SDC9_145208 [bioreactor metagenome]|uniref:Uncharacterized protein n=1 Tax=bioreactor metagenome TaxID=1076179 RepID=A0A645E803_9ZZZZ|nr:hypothetical protein [Paludibacter sp.]